MEPSCDCLWWVPRVSGGFQVGPTTRSLPGTVDNQVVTRGQSQIRWWDGAVVQHITDLLAEGFKAHEIQALLRRGELIRLRPGIYRRANEPAIEGTQREDPAEQRHLESAAVTMRGLQPGAALSHITAGLLHRLPIPRHLLGRVHITRPGRGGKVRSGVHLHRARIPDGHVIETAIGAATSLAMTVCDLARTLAPAAALACADHGLRDGVDRQLALGLLSSGRAPGSVRGREILRFADARSESVGESHSRWLISSMGLPQPVLQQNFVTNRGEFVARSDFWWPQQRMVGEFDGKAKYGRLLKPGQRIEDVIEAERLREQALRRLNIWVVRWTWVDLDKPEAFAEMLKAELDFAARTAGRRASSS